MCETECLTGTRVQELVDALHGMYEKVEVIQKGWQSVASFHCPEGCGCCCVDFEPDVLETEALYLAVWMLHHQKERAMAIINGSFISPRTDSDRGCMFFDPDSPWHCTVYGGRCLICRMFGYAGDRGRDGAFRWKPCKFLPLELDENGQSLHRQYTGTELQEQFGVLPLLMSDISSQVLSLDPDGAKERRPLREALCAALNKVVMLLRFLSSPTEPEPNPESPLPLAS